MNASTLETECEEAELEQEGQSLRLEQVSAALREALLRAEPGETGMQTVRAVGPAGQRYTAGLHDGHVFLLELPWPNPRNECRSLREEPRDVEWQPHTRNG